MHDHDTFFVVIMEKIYKDRLLSIFREQYGFFDPNKGTGPSRFLVGLDGTIYDDKEFQATSSPADNKAAEAVEDGTEIPMELISEEPSNPEYSPLEDTQMSKFKTFYIYRSKKDLDAALEEHRPVSGILVDAPAGGNDQARMLFYLLFKTKNTFSAVQVNFDDANGVTRGGLWYAPLTTTEPSFPVPDNFKAIQSMAKMSTVAIPMFYGIGHGSPDSYKYCVITNWWKERQPDGLYTLPGLDPTHYVREDNYEPILEVFEAENGGRNVI